MEKNINFASVALAERKDRLKWSRKKASEVTGLPIETMRAWETGRTNPSDHIKRWYLNDLASHGHPEKQTGIGTILSEIHAAVTGDRAPIPYNVLKDALGRVVSVHIQVRILDEIRKRMGW